nr:MAG TPA: hypothetical protein [Caudoviricetes sp.]
MSGTWGYTFIGDETCRFPPSLPSPSERWRAYRRG